MNNHHTNSSASNNGNGSSGFIDDTAEHIDSDDSSGTTSSSGDEEDDSFADNRRIINNPDDPPEEVSCTSLLKGITIEPMMFLHMFGMSCTSVILQNLYIQRICKISLNYTDAVCDDLEDNPTIGLLNH